MTPLVEAGNVSAVIARLLESPLPWKTGAVLVGALIIGIASFSLTSSTPVYSTLGHFCMSGIVRVPGFDPWTGEPYGMTYQCTNDLPELGDVGTRDVTESPPDAIAGRRAIPIPAGTAFGMLVLGGLAVANERRGRSPAVAAGPIPDSR